MYVTFWSTWSHKFLVWIWGIWELPSEFTSESAWTWGIFLTILFLTFETILENGCVKNVGRKKTVSNFEELDQQDVEASNAFTNKVQNERNKTKQCMDTAKQQSDHFSGVFRLLIDNYTFPAWSEGWESRSYYGGIHNTWESTCVSSTTHRPKLCWWAFVRRFLNVAGWRRLKCTGALFCSGLSNCSFTSQKLNRKGCQWMCSILWYLVYYLIMEIGILVFYVDMNT